jgi:phosphoglycerate dehydrogenase-like enzyme
MFKGAELKGTRLGILGFGAIGKMVSKAALI